MVRWIVFDDDTADAVIGKFKRGAAEIRRGAEPIDAALAVGEGSIVVLPTRSAGRLLLASFMPKGVRPVNTRNATPPALAEESANERQMSKVSVEGRFERMFGRIMTPRERVWYSTNKAGMEVDSIAAVETFSDTKSSAPKSSIPNDTTIPDISAKARI